MGQRAQWPGILPPPLQVPKGVTAMGPLMPQCSEMGDTYTVLFPSPKGLRPCMLRSSRRMPWSKCCSSAPARSLARQSSCPPWDLPSPSCPSPTLAQACCPTPQRWAAPPSWRRRGRTRAGRAAWVISKYQWQFWYRATAWRGGRSSRGCVGQIEQLAWPAVKLAARWDISEIAAHFNHFWKIVISDTQALLLNI